MPFSQPWRSDGPEPCCSAYRDGSSGKYGVELIGAKFEAIKKAEDRELFKESMRKIGLEVPKSDVASDVSEALAIADEIGYPVVVRPAFTLGGTGGGIATTGRS